MLIKLFKYELRSILKTFAVLWLAVLVLALVNHFTLGTFSLGDGGIFAALLKIIPMIVFVCFVVGMSVIAIVLLIRRFYGGLLGNEGYLMFTLPVKTWQLITAKGAAAALVSLISAIVGALAVMILFKWADVAKVIMNFLTEIAGDFELTWPKAIVLVIEALIVAIMGFARSIYQVYTAIALGHLFKKGRVGMAFVMYIAIGVVGSIITVIFGARIDTIGTLAVRFFAHGDYTPFGLLNLSALLLFIIYAVPVVIFHFVTEYILRTRLNLE